MHDHGPLPVLREGGDIALLIGCVDLTKQCSDEFLTSVIKEEKTARSPKQEADGNRKKSKGESKES
jgi:hypothetical protein